MGSAAAAEQIAPSNIGELPQADVVLLGEVHDNAHQHVNQTSAVRALKPAALVFEMLTSSQAKIVNDQRGADRDELATALDWANSGWPPFGMYYPIIAATDAPVWGAALPRGEVRRALREGAAQVFGKNAAAYGLETPLPETQQAAREANQQEAHCNALPPEMLPGMVEAQRLRDAALARAVVTAHAKTGGPVIVITGNGHARSDWGVPHNLRSARPDLSILSIGQFEAAPDPDPPHDVWLVTDPVEREDPCLAFR